MNQNAAEYKENFLLLHYILAREFADHKVSYQIFEYPEKDPTALSEFQKDLDEICWGQNSHSKNH